MAQFLPVLPVPLNTLPGVTSRIPGIGFDQGNLARIQQVSFLLPELSQAVRGLEQDVVEDPGMLLPLAIPITFVGNSLPVDTAPARLDLAVKQELDAPRRWMLRAPTAEAQLPSSMAGADQLELDVDADVASSRPAQTPVPGAAQPVLRELLPKPEGTGLTASSNLPARGAERADTNSHLPPSPPPLTREDPSTLNLPTLLTQSTVVQPNQQQTGQPVVVQVGPSVHHPDWNNAMIARVVWQAGAQIQHAEFRVHPPELGPVEVRVSVNNDQANVHFIAQHGFVRDALEDSIPRLRELLSHGGLTLANADVSDHGAAGRHDRATAQLHTDAVRGLTSLHDPVSEPVSQIDTVWLLPLGRIDVYA
jgi:hypothetical protein